jgi:hypothetical protein
MDMGRFQQRGGRSWIGCGSWQGRIEDLWMERGDDGFSLLVAGNFRLNQFDRRHFRARSPQRLMCLLQLLESTMLRLDRTANSCDENRGIEMVIFFVTCVLEDIIDARSCGHIVTIPISGYVILIVTKHYTKK